jgi:superfamily I DNA and/or RNA helicase
MTTAAGAGILEVFISHFKRAIRQEMDAMRERKGTFEIFLTNGERMESSETTTGSRYIYRLSSHDEKLVVGTECTLRTMKGEYLVRVERCDDPTITLFSGRTVETGTGEASLVIYPWFLYEKLFTVLDEIDSRRFTVDRALKLFGKLPAVFKRVELLCAHSALNPSQRAAVQLCSDSDLAFVWGPPGTGKTTTLARIVAELLAQKMRILLLATTNAALDQALEKVSCDPEGKEWIDAGSVVRIGRTDGPTFGAGLNDVLTRLNIVHQKKLSRMLKRRPAAETALSACRKAIDKLTVAEAPFQSGLFGNPSPPRLPPDLAAVFTTQRTSRLLELKPAELIGVIRRRAARVEKIRDLCAKGIEGRRNAMVRKEREVVDEARLILSSLTNAYFSPLMENQRFDVVIVEEASMAVLPALFYAACLGYRKTIMVGDPCQLPSIVQSDAEYVRKVMGRNIFEVAVADPLSSPLVAMLDTQYRMHPVIGRLVSDVFYSGRIRHGGNPAAQTRIAAMEPYAGAALVVLDTAGKTTCEQAGGQSRANAENAAICADLALRSVGAGAESVAIITPYVEQARLIRSIVKKSPERASCIECSTVHRFQGQECDVVILDTVDAEPMKPGVLFTERGSRSAASNLINVAVSRARGKLIIVADVRYFERRAPESAVMNTIRRALISGCCQTV